MSNVEKLYPANAADNPDNVLEQAMGQLQDVLIVGYDRDGDFCARCSSGLVDGGNLLWLIKSLEFKLMNGELVADPD